MQRAAERQQAQQEDIQSRGHEEEGETSEWSKPISGEDAVFSPGEDHSWGKNHKRKKAKITVVVGSGDEQEEDDAEKDRGENIELV